MKISQQTSKIKAKKMETTRQSKIARLVQKELSLIFQRRSLDFLGKMVSVTVVRVTPDYGLAKVYLSIFPNGENDKIMKIIESENKSIRHELAKITRNQLRKVPELKFYIDDSLDYASRIDELLK